MGPGTTGLTRQGEREAVGAVVVRGDGRVLLVRRGKPPLAGAWTLPGGHVEPGESPAEAVARELREETGLAVRVVRFVETVHLAAHTGEGRAFAIHEHLAVPVDEDAPVVAGDDAADARWVDPRDFERLGVSRAARDVVDRALALAAATGVR